MDDFVLDTPVAFIIFNRPETTARVFSMIAKARPKKLLVIADGARTNRDGDANKVAMARAIVEKVDWECVVLKNYSDENLGCRKRVSSGIDWVFEQVEEAIILEDDCLPELSFFQYCQELLERYRSDDRVAMIGGTNLLIERVSTCESYYFSRYMHIWGWATWRRAWKNYDVEARQWPSYKKNGILDSFIRNKGERKFWQREFDSVYRNKIDTWDYQWVLSSWVQNQLSIIPSVNLVKNIGFGVDATHTTEDSPHSKLRTQPIDFPLVHPCCMIPNSQADKYIGANNFTITLKRRIAESIIDYLKHLLQIFK